MRGERQGRQVVASSSMRTRTRTRARTTIGSTASARRGGRRSTRWAMEVVQPASLHPLPPPPLPRSRTMGSVSAHCELHGETSCELSCRATAVRPHKAFKVVRRRLVARQGDDSPSRRAQDHQTTRAGLARSSWARPSSAGAGRSASRCQHLFQRIGLFHAAVHRSAQFLSATMGWRERAGASRAVFACGVRAHVIPARCKHTAALVRSPDLDAVRWFGVGWIRERCVMCGGEGGLAARRRQQCRPLRIGPLAVMYLSSRHSSCVGR